MASTSLHADAASCGSTFPQDAVLHLDLGRELRGGQRQVSYLAERQKRAGRPVALACPAGAPLAVLARAAGIQVVDLPGCREFAPRVLLAARAALRRLQPAVVHTHDARSAALGAFLKALPGPLPSFHLVHTRRVSYPLSGAFSRWKYRAADRVAAVSREIADVLAASGVDPAKIVVIHSGLDPASYSAKRIKEAGEPLVVGFIGALTTQKGAEVLLEALALLKDVSGLPAWRAELVGDGPLGDSLRARACSLGLEAERLRFAGWRESRAVLPEFDLLAVPSVDGEGSSGVIKEGWAVGVPVVASDLASNLELVENEASGLTFPVGEAGGLAEALARLLREPGLRSRLAAGGRAALADFTADRMFEGYERLYAELAAK